MSDETFTENGSRRVNWTAAKAYYLALPAGQRTFRQVGARFRVSSQRVGQVARRDGWEKTAETIDERVERKAVSEIVRSSAESIAAVVRPRAERLARTLELYDRSVDLGLELLPLREDGAVDREKLGEGAPSLDQLLRRIPGLFRMAELAAGEATDRVQIADVQPVLSAFARIAVLEAAPERRAEVMRLLEAASAGLVALPAGEAA